MLVHVINCHFCIRQFPRLFKYCCHLSLRYPEMLAYVHTLFCSSLSLSPSPPPLLQCNSLNSFFPQSSYLNHKSLIYLSLIMYYSPIFPSYPGFSCTPSLPRPAHLLFFYPVLFIHPSLTMIVFLLYSHITIYCSSILTLH